MEAKTTRRRVLDYIRENQKIITTAPSVREIAEALDVSPPVVDYHVNRLIRQGLLVKHKEGRRLRYEFND